MSLRSKRAEAQKFLYENEDKLRPMLEEIRQAALALQSELGQDCIRDVYSRGSKQKALGYAKKEFKAVHKLARLLEDNPGLTVGKIDDLMGLTIVVFYPDQIDRVGERLKNKLQTTSLIECPDTKPKSSGYHATHLVFKSNHPDYDELRCEVQIKTMLHDSWAWKTHDLTYKPQGRLDERLSSMMGAFSDAIQSIEDQSRMLRDVIQDRWRVEDAWRMASRNQLLELILRNAKWAAFDQETQSIRQEILGNRLYKEAGGENTEYLRLRNQIKAVHKQRPFEGYLLEAMLAIIRDRRENRERAVTAAWECFDSIVPAMCADERQCHLVWCIPLVVQACGDLDAAVEMGRELLSCDPSNSSAKYPFTEKAVRIVKFNLANHLTESAFISGLPSGPRSAALEREIRSFLADASPQRGDDPSAYDDAEGMVDVLFSTDPDAVLAAIEKLEKGKVTEDDESKEYAKAYYVHNVGIAWQRYRELSAQRLKRPL